MTSAPRSAKFWLHHGPANTRDKSNTLMPSSGVLRSLTVLFLQYRYLTPRYRARRTGPGTVRGPRPPSTSLPPVFHLGKMVQRIECSDRPGVGGRSRTAF